MRSKTFIEILLNIFTFFFSPHALYICYRMILRLLIIYLASKSYPCILHHKIYKHARSRAHARARTHTHTHTHTNCHTSPILISTYSSPVNSVYLVSKMFKCKPVILLHRDADYLCHSCNSTITPNPVTLTSL